MTNTFYQVAIEGTIVSSFIDANLAMSEIERLRKSGV